MSKAGAKVAMENSLRTYQGTLRGTRINKEPILIRVTPECVNINNVLSTTVCCQVELCDQKLLSNLA